MFICDIHNIVTLLIHAFSDLVCVYITYTIHILPLCTTCKACTYTQTHTSPSSSPPLHLIFCSGIPQRGIMRLRFSSCLRADRESNTTITAYKRLYRIDKDLRKMLTFATLVDEIDMFPEVRSYVYYSMCEFCTCLLVYVYVCMHMYVCIRMYVRVYICIACVLMCRLFLYVETLVSEYVYTCIHLCVRVCTDSIDIRYTLLLLLCYTTSIY